jgi:hypothetical protein
MPFFLFVCLFVLSRFAQCVCVCFFLFWVRLLRSPPDKRFKNAFMATPSRATSSTGTATPVSSVEKHANAMQSTARRTLSFTQCEDSIPNGQWSQESEDKWAKFGTPWSDVKPPGCETNKFKQTNTTKQAHNFRCEVCGSCCPEVQLVRLWLVVCRLDCICFFPLVA